MISCIEDRTPFCPTDPPALFSIDILASVCHYIVIPFSLLGISSHRCLWVLRCFQFSSKGRAVDGSGRSAAKKPGMNIKVSMVRV